MKYHLACIDCGRTYEADYNSQICSKCSGLLEVIYDGKLKQAEYKGSFWDFKGALPDSKYKEVFVGSTPAIKSVFTGLDLKLEFTNPTHSFKDRGSVIEVAKAHEYGFKEVVCASTGNMAYSIAYYSKLYGIKARIFIGKSANEDKIKDIRSVGDTEITKVDGDFTKAQSLALQYSKRNDVFLCGDYCYRTEGQKTLMYEIAYSLKGIENIIIPVGNATLLSATYKAINELADSKKLKSKPKIIAVQAQKCSPLVTAIKSRKKIRYTEPKTKADAIAVGYPTYGYMGIEAILATKGAAIAVSEKEMHDEQKLFYRDYGVLAELASVSTIAAYKRIMPRSKSVAVITGSNV